MLISCDELQYSVHFAHICNSKPLDALLILCSLHVISDYPSSIKLAILPTLLKKMGFTDHSYFMKCSFSLCGCSMQLCELECLCLLLSLHVQMYNRN